MPATVKYTKMVKTTEEIEVPKIFFDANEDRWDANLATKLFRTLAYEEGHNMSRLYDNLYSEDETRVKSAVATIVGLETTVTALVQVVEAHYR